MPSMWQILTRCGSCSALRYTSCLVSNTALQAVQAAIRDCHFSVASFGEESMGVCSPLLKTSRCVCSCSYHIHFGKVSIADPRANDCPLVAVSDQFEQLTGYSREEFRLQISDSAVTYCNVPLLHFALQLFWGVFFQNSNCCSSNCLHSVWMTFLGFLVVDSESFFILLPIVQGNHWKKLPLPQPELSIRPMCRCSELGRAEQAG